jgi:hypothetical protein
MIYYKDTCKFYKSHKAEINDLLKESMSETGIKNPEEMFSDKWDSDDPLALDTMNQNLLAWFAYEEIARQLANKAGIEA